MIELTITTSSKAYPIYLGEETLKRLPSELEKLGASQVVVVSNNCVWELYGTQLRQILNDDRVLHVLLPEGEVAKSLAEIEKVYRFLIEKKIDRKAVIIALGGGVVGDAAGFVAATYMRGIRFIQVPTTLLSQVDSSVGGKVGINHPLGKNLIGAFYQPEAVFIDLNTLSTLPEREIRCGLGEVIKYGYIADSDLWELIKSNLQAILSGNKLILLPIIQRCLEIKRDIVNADEKEEGIRAILNFGHTFAHAVEAFHNYEEIKHGEAVLIGMIPALFLSDFKHYHINFLKHKEFLFSVFNYNGMKITDINRLVDLMENDKKNSNGEIRCVYLEDIGKAKVSTFSRFELKVAWSSYFQALI